MFRRIWLSLAITAYLTFSGQVQANPFDHNTNGVFDQQEWSGPNVSKTQFPLVGASGGATLYVEQGFSNLGAAAVARPSPGTLFLGYDITLNPAGATPPNANSFFDVFFQV